jgi:hypothetical protein
VKASRVDVAGLINSYSVYEVVVCVQIQGLMVCKVHTVLESKGIKDSVFNLLITFIWFTLTKKIISHILNFSTVPLSTFRGDGDKMFMSGQLQPQVIF